jgi:hypothetical protein
MSQGKPTNSFDDPRTPHLNPYSSPQIYGEPTPSPTLMEVVKARVRAPAICLIAYGMFSMVASVITALTLVVLQGARLQLAPEHPLAAVLKLVLSPDTFFIHFISFFANLTIVVGAVQMLYVKIRPMCFVAACVALLNFANPCCLIGIPIGMWSLVILLQSDVAKAFEENY